MVSRRRVWIGSVLAAVVAAVGAPAASAHPAAALCKSGYYKNVSGHCVHRPDSNAAGASAQCRDHSYSHSQHASGTCSGHGGVLRWIHHP